MIPPSVDSSVSAAPRDPLYENAYKFWDPSPNPTIFRAAVTNRYDGYEHVRATMRVLTPDSVKEGIVSVYKGENWRLYEIAKTMKDGFVLVRRKDGTQDDGVTDSPLQLEPLVNIRAEDGAMLKGREIATVAANGKITYLPIVGQSRKLGVIDGLGYIEADSEGLKFLYPVFVDGAENKMQQVLAEISARRISDAYRTSRTFYAGEVPMTVAEQMQRRLARVDYCIKDKREYLNKFKFSEAAEGGRSADGLEQHVPNAEQFFFRAMSLFKPPVREAGMMQNARQRTESVKGVISQIAAMRGLTKREEQIIYGMYKEGSPEHAAFMKWWRSAGVDAYIGGMEDAGLFRWDDGTPASAKKDRKRAELSAGMPFGEISIKGFFDTDALEKLANYGTSQPYTAAVSKALEMAAAGIMNGYDWRKKPFSFDDMKDEALKLVGENLFWRAVRLSFNEMDVHRVWDELLQVCGYYPYKKSLLDKITQPYIEKVMLAAAG